MDFFKLKENVCRICLEHNIKLNWNDEIQKLCGVSYKDCYFKFTQLVERDPDLLPTNICARCANEVKNAYILFERALESFNILCNVLDANEDLQGSYVKLCNSPQKMISETFSSDENIYVKSPVDDKLEIDDVICYSPVYDNYETNEMERPINNCKENSMSENVNIENFKSLEQQLIDGSDIILMKSAVGKDTGCRRASDRSFETTLELQLELKIHGTKKLKLTAKTDSGKMKMNKSFQTSKKEQDTSCDIKLIPKRTLQEVHKLKNSTHRLSLNVLPNVKKFLRNPKQSSFEESIQSCKTSNSPNLEPIICEELSNSSVTSAFNTEELYTNYATKSCVELEKQLKSSDYSPLDLNPCANENSLPVPSAPDPSIPLEMQTFSVTEHSVEVNPNESSDCSNLERNLSESYPKLSDEHSKPKEMKNSRIRKKKRIYDPSEISLLHEIFGKNYDVNSLLPKSTPKPREKICQYCSIKVKGTSHLMAHEATHLENRERNVICPHCGIKLYTKLALTEHLKIHDDKREKKHKCEFCEKAFFHKGALNVHRRIHLGLMVKCQICPKEFYRQIDLDRHLASHSAVPLQNNGVKNVKYTVQCQYCNKSVFTYKWREHKAAHLNQPEVKCKICDKDFFSRQSCTKHLNKVHRKTAKDYDDHIHYYVDCSSRLSHLMIRQQESVQPLTIK